MLRRALFGSLLTLGVGSSTESSAATAHWQLRALTFNTALAPGFEPNTAQRLPKILSVSSALGVSSFHTCAINTAGQPFCWGRNDLGQVLGRSDSDQYLPYQLSNW